jgi:hypothetical protein
MRHIPLYRLMTLSIVVAVCSGCAFGHKYNYHEVVPNLRAEGSGHITVATHDQRPYVMSGSQGPHFVGLTRGGYGNPFNVGTQSGRPLAEDMTQALCHALQKKGFACRPIMVTAKQSPEDVRHQLQVATENLALLLTLREWKSDTYIGTVLVYDVTLRVFDASNTVLAEVQRAGRDVLGSNFWNPTGVAYTAVPKAFKEKMEELLNHPEVLSALQTVDRS